MSQPIKFVPAGAPVREPVTKSGGQPVWLEEPQWPLSRALGEQMAFMMQVRIDDAAPGTPTMAYLFMTDPEDPEDFAYVERTWEPDFGENAVILQPGGRLPRFVEEEGAEPVPVPVVAEAEGPSHNVDHLPVPIENPSPTIMHQRLGGEPDWLSEWHDRDALDGWRFLVQFDNIGPYGPNFGDCGIGYAFVSPDGREGRFMWEAT